MTDTVIRDETLAPIGPLLESGVAILGFGNQGRAHALNLRDRGVAVCIGARPGGGGHARAVTDGFDPVPYQQAAQKAALVIIALPDEVHGTVWRETLGKVIEPGQSVGFIHGFSVHFGHVTPPAGVGVVMVAPKGPGTTLRQRFELGQGIPALFAVHQESTRANAEQLGLAWASGIGSARAAIIRTTFAAEAESDLFGEQAVLCGGMTGLILAAFETLVEAGYPPELAYIECCHEVKQVADLVYERGLGGMMQAISNTAEFGAYHAAPKLVDDAMRHKMHAILEDIRSGAFAKQMSDDHAAGSPWINAQRTALRDHGIEQASRVVRSYMSFQTDSSSQQRESTPD